MSLDFCLRKDLDVGAESPYVVELFWRNITHNLTPMWDKAGVYDALYNSSEKFARDITGQLEDGLQKMMMFPDEYRKLNPANGWGDYDGAIQFLIEVINACKEYPLAEIYISK